MDYKKVFMDYCKGKIKTLGEATYIDTFGEEVTYPIIMEADIREFSNLRVLLPGEEDDILLAIDENNQIKINSPMLNAIGYAGRMEFKTIDRDFYNDILEWWDDCYMDEIVENYVK